MEVPCAVKVRRSPNLDVGELTSAAVEQACRRPVCCPDFVEAPALQGSACRACAGFDVSVVVEGQPDVNSVPWFEMPKNMFRHCWELATNSTRYNQMGRNITSSLAKKCVAIPTECANRFWRGRLAIGSRDGPRRIWRGPHHAVILPLRGASASQRKCSGATAPPEVEARSSAIK